MNTFVHSTYLRVSLLSSCNLHCSYCLPAGSRRPAICAPAHNVKSAIHFLHGAGIHKIRFTGGEPTLYKELCELVNFIKSLDPDVHTAITSNGVQLESLAETLGKSGLDSVNISLDTINPHTFRKITGTDHLNQVITGIDAAAKHIKTVKLNCVLIRGINDKEVVDLITFADARNLDIRFIEFMPNRYSTPGDHRYISGDEIRRRLPWNLQAFPTVKNSAARYYIADSLNIRIGFISSVSHPFCESCDRLRLAADGRLYTCLYDSNSFNLFELLESGDKTAQAALHTLIQSKQARGCPGTSEPAGVLPAFSSIGG